RDVGGPARISGKGMTARERRAIAPLLDPAAANEGLSPGEGAEVFGLPGSEGVEAGCKGVCVIPNFNPGVGRLTTASDPDDRAVDDLLIYADGASGLEFADPAVVAAWRNGALDLAALQQTGRHENDELRNSRRPAEERLPHDELTELPDLSPMRAVLAA